MAKLVFLEIQSSGRYYFRLRCDCDEAYIDGDGQLFCECPKCGRKHKVWVGTEVETVEPALEKAA